MIALCLNTIFLDDVLIEVSQLDVARSVETPSKRSVKSILNQHVFSDTSSESQKGFVVCRKEQRVVCHFMRLLFSALSCVGMFTTSNRFEFINTQNDQFTSSHFEIIFYVIQDFDY